MLWCRNIYEILYLKLKPWYACFLIIKSVFTLFYIYKRKYAYKLFSVLYKSRKILVFMLYIVYKIFKLLTITPKPM